MNDNLNNNSASGSQNLTQMTDNSLFDGYATYFSNFFVAWPSSGTAQVQAWKKVDNPKFHPKEF